MATKRFDQKFTRRELMRYMALGGAGMVAAACVPATPSVVEKVVGGELTGPTLRDVLRIVGAVDVPIDDIGVNSNCNTPEALSAALRANEE